MPTYLRECKLLCNAALLSYSVHEKRRNHASADAAAAAAAAAASAS